MHTSIPPGQRTHYLSPRSECVQAYFLVSALTISAPGLCAYKHTSWSAHSLSPSQVPVRTSIPPGQRTHYLFPRSLRTSIPPGQRTHYLLPRSLCVQAYLLVSALTISSPGHCAYKHTSWSAHSLSPPTSWSEHSLSPSQVTVSTSITPGQRAHYLLPRSLCVQAYLLVSALTISYPGLCAYKHTSWSAHSLLPPTSWSEHSLPAYLLVSALTISSPVLCAYKHTSWSAHSLSPSQIPVRTSIPHGQRTHDLLPKSLCVQVYLLVRALTISTSGPCAYKHTSWSAHSLSPTQVSVRTSIPPGQRTHYLLPPPGQSTHYLLPRSLCVLVLPRSV